MKAKMLSRALLGFWASIMLVPAMADPPVKKPVPTTVVPLRAPPAAAAPAPAPVPVVVVAKPLPTPPRKVQTCYWEEELMETMVTPSRQYFTPGFVVDPYCGPTITLSSSMSTVPGSVIQTTGRNLVCR